MMQKAGIFIYEFMNLERFRLPHHLSPPLFLRQGEGEREMVGKRGETSLRHPLGGVIKIVV